MRLNAFRKAVQQRLDRLVAEDRTRLQGAVKDVRHANELRSVHVTRTWRDGVTTYDGGYDVWGAVCSCGWRSKPHRSTQRDAENDAIEHAADMNSRTHRPEDNQ